MGSIYVRFDEINRLWVFTRYATKAFIAKPQSNCKCWPHLVHLILIARNLLWKTSENIFLRNLGVGFWHFPSVALNHGGTPIPQYLLEFSWNLLQHSVATSKMELFVGKNGKWQETANDCCYRELCLKCDRAPRLDSETHR